MSETCDPQVTLYVRAIGSEAFHVFPLVADGPFMYSAMVPVDKAGIEYYIDVLDRKSDIRALVPSTGQTAPDVIYAMPANTVKVDLPAYRFGAPTSGELVADLPYGAKIGQAGLSQVAPSGDSAIVGPAAIAVDDRNHVLLLDSLNERVSDLSVAGYPLVAENVPGAATDLAWTSDGLVVFGKHGSTTFVGTVSMDGFDEWAAFDSDVQYMHLGVPDDGIAGDVGHVGIVVEGDTRGFVDVSPSGVSTRVEPGVPLVNLADLAAGSVVYQVSGSTLFVALVEDNRVSCGWQIKSPTEWGPSPLGCPRRLVTGHNVVCIQRQNNGSAGSPLGRQPSRGRAGVPD